MFLGIPIITPTLIVLIHCCGMPVESSGSCPLGTSRCSFSLCFHRYGAESWIL